MLVVKGFRAIFKMEDGQTVRPPAGHAILHDESGKDWPRCAALIAAIKTHPNDPPVSDAAAKSYLGAEPRVGSTTLPPRALGSWSRVGRIEEFLYTRRRPRDLPGKLQDDYYHPIEKGVATLFEWRRGIYRVELGRGCLWNWRGIVRP